MNCLAFLVFILLSLNQIWQRKRMQRDHFIDFVKGITIINIVIMHTLGHSGGEFPLFLINITLLADVPIFFLCSGLTSSPNIKKTIIRLFKLQMSFTLFLLIIFIVSSIYQHEISWKLFLDNILHDYQIMPPFHSVYYSLWYIKAYIIVMLIGSVILHFATDNRKLNIILFILFCGILYGSLQGSIVGNSYLSLIIFYLFIFLVGYRFKDINMSVPIYCTTIIFILISLFMWFNIPNQPQLIHIYKFPPHIIYLLISALSLSTILFLRKRVKIGPKNIFVYPGKNSLFFYFAQGVGGSLIVGVVAISMQYHLKWYIIFLLAFSVNLAITCILAPILKYCDSLMWRGIYAIQNIIKNKN